MYEFSRLGAGSMPMSLGNQILDKLIQRTCYSPDHTYEGACIFEGQEDKVSLCT